jgi:hypothetical protein
MFSGIVSVYGQSRAQELLNEMHLFSHNLFMWVMIRFIKITRLKMMSFTLLFYRDAILILPLFAEAMIILWCIHLLPCGLVFPFFIPMIWLTGSRLAMCWTASPSFLFRIPVSAAGIYAPPLNSTLIMRPFI